MKTGLSFVTAADHGFHQGLGALLKSFALSNRDLAPLSLIVMDCGLEKGVMECLEEDLASFSKKYDIALTLTFPKADLSRWHRFPAHWESYATYAFLEAISMVDTKFLVFADADMLHFSQITNTLKELEHSGCKMAGVVDTDYDTLQKDYYVNHLSPLKDGEETMPYMNGGYLIFNRSKFHAEKLYEFVDSLDAAKTHERFKGVKKFKHDQTIINCFVKGDFLELDDSYNYFCKENSRFSNLEERKNFHFISNPKPWEKGDYTSLARETVFQSAEALLNGDPVPEISRLVTSPTHEFQKLFYRVLGKSKRVKKLEGSEISSDELENLQKTITDWCS